MSQNVYTSVASSMLLHTEILSSRLAKVTIGESKRVLLISELSGPSSNGGALARQTLMLSGAGEQPVCGWVDFAAAQAEVRDYASMKAGYEQRFRRAFDVREAEYRGWLQRIMAVLKELEVRVEITGDEVASAVTEPGRQEPAAPAADDDEKSSLLPVVIAGVIALAGIVLAVVLLTR